MVDVQEPDMGSAWQLWWQQSVSPRRFKGNQVSFACTLKIMGPVLKQIHQILSRSPNFWASLSSSYLFTLLSHLQPRQHSLNDREERERERKKTGGGSENGENSMPDSSETYLCNNMGHKHSCQPPMPTSGVMNGNLAISWHKDMDIHICI